MSTSKSITTVQTRVNRKKVNANGPPATTTGANHTTTAPDSLDSTLSTMTTTAGNGNGRFAGRKTFSRLDGRLSASQGSLARSHWGSLSSLAPSERSTATFLLRNGNGKAAPLSKLELTNAIPLTTSARFFLNYSSVRSVLTSDEQLVHCPLHLSHRCNPFSCYHPQMYNNSAFTGNTSSSNHNNSNSSSSNSSSTTVASSGDQVR